MAMAAVRLFVLPAVFIPFATFALTTCSDSGPVATCSPNGTELHIAVLESQSHQFTTDCLAAPSGVPFTIRFDNQDISPHGNHNIHIFDGDGSSFVGDIAPHGTSITYEVPAFEAGTYQFQCDAHPAMNGAFIAK
jgi:plastocyanin